MALHSYLARKGCSNCHCDCLWRVLGVIVDRRVTKQSRDSDGASRARNGSVMAVCCSASAVGWVAVKKALQGARGESRESREIIDSRVANNVCLLSRAMEGRRRRAACATARGRAASLSVHYRSLPCRLRVNSITAGQGVTCSKHSTTVADWPTSTTSHLLMGHVFCICLWRTPQISCYHGVVFVGYHITTARPQTWPTRRQPRPKSLLWSAR